MTEKEIKSNAEKMAEDFFDEIKQDSTLDIRNDREWPQRADTMLDKIKESYSETYHLYFWLKLAELFEKEQQEKGGQFHKGQHFWRISLIYLHRGLLEKSIDYLDLAIKEDRKRGDSFSAAIGFLSVLKPLIYRFKNDKNDFIFSENEENFKLYQGLTNKEKRRFAEELFNLHDYSVRTLANQINHFEFIVDQDRRNIIRSLYQELSVLVDIWYRHQIIDIGYGCIFITGSILEAMTDDLFSRESAKLWKLFRQDEAMVNEVGINRKMISNEFREKYCEDLTLGQKLRIIKSPSIHNKIIMPKEIILQMLIIGEYRNLIHPRRSVKFEFKPSYYLAGVLYNFFSSIAHHWWTIVTCYENPDLDGFAGAIGYSELLNKQGKATIPCISGEPSHETNYLINKYNLRGSFKIDSDASQREAILVDASTINGLPKNLDIDKVIEIIDHRVVNDSNKFTNAEKVQIEEIGAAATLIVEKFKDSNINPSEASATLLYGAIILNTLNFKSSTTTERDTKAAEWLDSLYKFSNDFAKQMFEAKSKT